MDIESTVATLKALFEETFEKFAAVMAHRRLGVRMNDESVRNLDPAGHFFFDPKRSAGTDRRPAVLLDVGARATTGKAIWNALQWFSFD